jgi:lipoate-protein ligase B
LGRLEGAVEIREGTELGAWTARGKFAAVGIKIREGIVQHGLSINGYRTPSSFQGLRPCGLDLPVDFLLNSEADLDPLGQEILATAGAVFLDEVSPPRL